MRLSRELLFVAGAVLVVALCAVGVVLARPRLLGTEEGIPVEGTFVCEQTGHKWTGVAYKVHEYDPYVMSKESGARTARQTIECASCGEWVLPPIPGASKAFRNMTAHEYRAWEKEAEGMLADAICPECAGPLAPRKQAMGERRKLGSGHSVIASRKHRSTETRTRTGTAQRGYRSERRGTGDGKGRPSARGGPGKRVRVTRRPDPLRAKGAGTPGYDKSRPFQRSSRKEVPAFDEFYAYRTRPYSYFRYGGDAYSDVYSRTGPYRQWGAPPLRDMFYRTQPYYRRGREQDFYRAPSRRPYGR
jgi:hypothetical protein